MAPPSVASRCDKGMGRREQLTAVFSFTLHRNEINKIAQAHRVVRTGRLAAGGGNNTANLSDLRSLDLPQKWLIGSGWHVVWDGGSVGWAWRSW